MIFHTATSRPKAPLGLPFRSPITNDRNMRERTPSTFVRVTAIPYSRWKHSRNAKIGLVLVPHETTSKAATDKRVSRSLLPSLLRRSRLLASSGASHPNCCMPGLLPGWRGFIAAGASGREVKGSLYLFLPRQASSKPFRDEGGRCF